VVLTTSGMITRVKRGGQQTADRSQPSQGTQSERH